MSYMPRVEAAPAPASATWSDLSDELGRWQAVGRIATLWWRDDDAVAATPALDRLLAAAADVPLGFAVIPGGSQESLAERLADAPQVVVLQHGWQHTNHSGEGKKSEYPGSRPAGEVAAELAIGRERLLRLFGERAAPVFVPPWNRIADSVLPLLPVAGFDIVSTMARPHLPSPPPGLGRLDIHVDLIAWGAGRGFIGEGAALAGLVRQLRARRVGLAAPDAPTGILSHHLVTDAAGFAFLAALRVYIAGHPAAQWVRPHKGQPR